MPVNVRDQYGSTLLIIACQNGNKKIAKLILRRGNLHACMHLLLCSVIVSISAGGNINAMNHKGNTPLHYCFHYGYGDTLGEYIIGKGADPQSKNNAGKITYDGI